MKRRGAMMVLVGSMLVLVFGMTAFTIDLGNLASTKATLVASADAAALAAAGNLIQADDLAEVRATAIEYAHRNVPGHYGTVLYEDNVIFGSWDPVEQTFTPGDSDPNAIRVIVERSEARGNGVGFFFGGIFGATMTDLSAEAVAVGAISTATANLYDSVYVTSTKDLSNVVLGFDDGIHQKFEPLSGYSATFQGTGDNEGKEVVCVWIKSGSNASGEGPGYGERIDYPGDDYDGDTIHGDNVHHGPVPHVTATFQATGVEFPDSGSISPVRLVR